MNGRRRTRLQLRARYAERPGAHDDTNRGYWSLKPRLEKLGLGWASFQVMRRANANLGRRAGVDDKVAADQRGHGVGVSLDVYANSDLTKSEGGSGSQAGSSSNSVRRTATEAPRRAFGGLNRKGSVGLKAVNAVTAIGGFFLSY
jgi:hypothetical protein